MLERVGHQDVYVFKRIPIPLPQHEWQVYQRNTGDHDNIIDKPTRFTVGYVCPQAKAEINRYADVIRYINPQWKERLQTKPSI